MRDFVKERIPSGTIWAIRVSVSVEERKRVNRRDRVRGCTYVWAGVFKSGCVCSKRQKSREREMTIWFMFPFLFLQQNLIFSKFSAPKRVQIFWSWVNKKLSNDKISVLGLQPLSCYEANWNRTWVTQVHRSNHWSKRGVRSNIPHVFEILNVYTNVYAWGHTNV